MAVEVIARGLRENPLHVQALGSDASDRMMALRRLFRVAVPLVARKGTLLGNFDNDRLVGVAGMVRPHQCRPGTAEVLTVVPRLLSGLGFWSFRQLKRWLDAWKKYDPNEPHWHVGPVAVDAHLQGRGIGSALMRECCSRIDEEHSAGYLETDKRANVVFYEKFGF